MRGTRTAETARAIAAAIVAVSTILAGCVQEEPAPPTATTPEPTDPTGPTPTPPPDGDACDPVAAATAPGDAEAGTFLALPGLPGGSVAAVGHADEGTTLDLYVAGPDGGRLLLGTASAGNATDGALFCDATSRAGVACEDCDATSVALLDVTEDARADLIVLGRDGLRLFVNQGNATFAEEADARGLSDAAGVALGLADVENDGDLDLVLAPGAGPLEARLNDGNGSFAPPAPVAPEANGTSFTFLFLDDDELLDIVVSGPAGLLLYLNERGSFENVTALARFPPGLRAKSLAVLDYDNDQSMDLLVASEDGVHVLQNSRRKSFIDRSDGLGLPTGSFAAALPIDVDNDGWTDVLALSPDGATLLRNRDGRDMEPDAGAGLPGGAFQAVARGDFDLDGREDALALAPEGSTLLLNRADAFPYFHLELVGNESNDAGIGVKVTLSSGTFIMLRQTSGGGSPAVAVPANVHFGLGPQVADMYTLAIKWPSDVLQFENIERARVMDRQLVARESSSEAPWAEC